MSRFEGVIDRHPDQAALIRRMVVAKADFGQLCEDYITLCDMIADLESRASTGQTGADLQSTRTEYASLRSELESDIARALSQFSQNPAS